MFSFITVIITAIVLLGLVIIAALKLSLEQSIYLIMVVILVGAILDIRNKILIWWRNKNY